MSSYRIKTIADHPTRPRPADRSRGRCSVEPADVSIAVALGYVAISTPKGFSHWVNPVGESCDEGKWPAEIAYAVAQHKMAYEKLVQKICYDK